MDNTLVYEAGDCGSIPYVGAKFRIATANLNQLSNGENKMLSCLMYASVV